MIKKAMNSKDFELSSYNFDLPTELIAQRPESKSRLLIYKIQTQEVIHDYFDNIATYLPADTLLVFNQSKVFPSRLKGFKKSGGKAELFLLSLASENFCYKALIKTRSKKRIGDRFYFDQALEAQIESIDTDGTFGVSFNIENLREYLDQYAKIPIPPYIRNGESDEEDRRAYQTVFARHEGSVAAPTAGLHFKDHLLLDLKKSGINSAFVTLHVGLGTFRPVATSNILDHQMHAESFFIDQVNLDLILNQKNQRRSLIAVGTTSLRVLESIHDKKIDPDKEYATNIFLHPGKEIQSVDGLVTNFHLPQSSLLMLVSTLIGREKTLELYQLAIKEKYRFFSYGDGMLILK